MQITRDAVTIGEHRQLLLRAVLLPQLQRQRGLLGERGQQRHLSRLERDIEEGPAQAVADAAAEVQSERDPEIEPAQVRATCRVTIADALADISAPRM